MTTDAPGDNQRRSFLGRLLAGMTGALAAPAITTRLRAAILSGKPRRSVRVRLHPDAVPRTTPLPRKHV